MNLSKDLGPLQKKYCIDQAYHIFKILDMFAYYPAGQYKQKKKCYSAERIFFVTMDNF